ncbi:type II toxin-antitoxin system HicB family antitoxin [Runella salmonicolor]|uniref:Type II toxin-antitoxin system HicB family antitoxin n=1 Tax=Runella salmonicolor TaxID=2950278 RepID=A0ABT1FT54_9BACT|nr:type II toxin-antitoxin system HicB family antitoxin [Runella salmonicolor]MCP1384951.1 type II toxin-antitoxin system HicB family antitoxin [Runella salmonicolor]
MLHLEYVIWKEEQYFVAQCLNIDISSFGETRQEALDNLNEALALYLEDNSQENVTKIEQPELVHATISYA